jgi:hypothetical protein
MAKKRKTKATARKPRAKAAAGEAGSKTDIVGKLLVRAGGCSGREILEATGWPTVSVPAMAKACGLKLRREKTKGEPTRYFGEAVA